MTLKFVDHDTLKSVSELSRPSAIRRWLDSRGIPYIVGNNNWPKVLEDTLLSRLQGSDTTPTGRATPSLRPWNG